MRGKCHQRMGMRGRVVPSVFHGTRIRPALVTSRGTGRGTASRRVCVLARTRGVWTDPARVDRPPRNLSGVCAGCWWGGCMHGV
jgi:hypothetical protein